MPSVLVIDDERAIRDSVRQVLERRGFTVFTSEDGDVGFERFREEKLDLVIVDMVMPRCDGLQVIRKIREISAGAPILAISGGGNFQEKGYTPQAGLVMGYLLAASKYGADAVLTKPFRRDHLLSTVRSLVPN
jgi:DNA-binding response OmpR family regulator